MNMNKLEIERALRDALKVVGFKGSNPYIYDFDDAILGWLGVNVHLHRGQQSYYTIDPNVGVHYPPLMKLFYSLSETKYPRVPVATVARNIGYLSPTSSFMGYELLNPKGIGNIVQVIVSDIRSYGFPWMKKLLDRKVLEQALIRYQPPEFAAELLPIYYWLEGKAELIDDTISNYRRKLAHKTWFTKRYGEFERRLRQVMKERNSKDWNKL